MTHLIRFRSLHQRSLAALTPFTLPNDTTCAMGRWLVVVAILVGLGWVAGQEYRLAVVVSESGPAAALGQQQAAAARVFASRLRVTGGSFGRAFEVIVEDDGSNPRLAVEIVERLVADGVHALVCCTGEAASRQVTGLVSAGNVLTLSPSRVANNPAGGPVWHYSLVPSETTLLRSVVRHASSQGLAAIGLMTLANGFGEVAVTTLERELLTAAMELRVVAEYRPDVEVLTPEALWVATREPSAVVVWGLRRDSLLAVDGLRRRGYRGPIYLRPSVLDPAAGGVDLFALERVRVPLAPIALFDSLAAGHPNGSATRQIAGVLAGSFGPDAITPAAAVVIDALTLLEKSVEQAVVYGVAPTEVVAFRQAMRDAAVGLAPLEAASGTIDLTETSPETALPSGLAMGQAVSGRLVHSP